jgi:hypothetical protein
MAKPAKKSDEKAKKKDESKKKPKASKSEKGADKPAKKAAVVPARAPAATPQRKQPSERATDHQGQTKAGSDDLDYISTLTTINPPRWQWVLKQ